MEGAQRETQQPEMHLRNADIVPQENKDICYNQTPPIPDPPPSLHTYPQTQTQSDTHTFYSQNYSINIPLAAFQTDTSGVFIMKHLEGLRRIRQTLAESATYFCRGFVFGGSGALRIIIYVGLFPPLVCHKIVHTCFMHLVGFYLPCLRDFILCLRISVRGPKYHYRHRH